MNNSSNENKILILCGIIPVIWISLLIAPFIDKGLVEIINNFPKAMNNPFDIVFTNNSLKSICIGLFFYLIFAIIYLSSEKNYRRKEEHGSAKWGSIRSVRKKYYQRPYTQNKILTAKILMGYNAKKHRRNLNTMVIGGSGAGKTRFYGKPNLMQANTSFVILDPKGELTRAEGYLLKAKGYDVKVFDLLNMDKSLCYNPFYYLRNDNDVQRLVTNLFKSTTPKGSQSQDPFWDQAACMLLMALIFYLWYEAPEEEQNFSMVMEMLRCADVKEEDETYLNPLDILFNQLEMEQPEHIALKYYREYRGGSPKTLKSINLTLISRLDKFNLSSLEKLTKTDELELDKLGQKKTALFAIISDTDTSFNFLISILYTQIFQQLFSIADFKFDGSLPVPVHFLMDEFANVSLPDDFAKILSVMRSRGVSVSIIIQNMAQLKSLFDKDWEGIVGNCDEFLFLGGNEQSTHKYVSDLLGKETIDTNSFGLTHGDRGNYSTNYQVIGRELLTSDEVRMLDNNHAILLIRGERPIYDKKYDLLKHPNIKLTEDGGYKTYYHGQTNNDLATIKLDFDNKGETISKIKQNKINEYEIISSKNIERYLRKEEDKDEKKNKTNK